MLLSGHKLLYQILLPFRDGERYRVLFCGFLLNGPTENFLKSPTRAAGALGTESGAGWVVRCDPCAGGGGGELRRDIACYSFGRNGGVIFFLCSTVVLYELYARCPSPA
jgi:hypothetical protein